MTRRLLRIKSLSKAYGLHEAIRLDMSKENYELLKDAPEWHQRQCGLLVLTSASFENYWAIERAFRLVLQERRYTMFRISGFLRLMPFEVADAYDLLVETDMIHREDEVFLTDMFGPDVVADPANTKVFWRQVDEFLDKAGSIVSDDRLGTRNLYLCLDDVE